MIFHSQLWPGHDLGDYCFTKDLFWPSLKDYSNFADISQFYSLASQGNLPTFSYLEPAWYEIEDRFGWNGNDYHPPANLNSGELFVFNLFSTLKKSSCWNQYVIHY